MAAAILFGCAESRDYEPRLEAERMQRVQNLTDQCKREFPDTIKQAVSRTSCITKVIAAQRQYVPYPDLLDQELAMALLLAEKVQTGKMTLVEKDAAMAQLRSQSLAEQERRDRATRSVNAQESAAPAANRASSFSCVQTGKTVICN